MVASTESGQRKIMDTLNETDKKYDMIINVKKTKVIKMSRHEEMIKIGMYDQKV